MRIFLIRHAEAVGNRERRLISKTGGRLTQEGVEQSKRVGHLLSLFSIAKVLTSPADRCVETSLHIASTLDLRPQENIQLMERDLGPYEGVPVSEIEASRLAEGHKFLDATQDWEGIDGVEQDVQVFSRIMSVVEHCRTSGGGDVVMVTHAGVIKSFISMVLDLPRTKTCVLKFPNASITLLEGPEPFWRLRFLSVPSDFGGAK